jgi:type II secretory ATPase GspE/PulE/Tfp pilus assembly ATPase PilB-like protein
MTEIPQILDRLIIAALNAHSSDIHIQPYPHHYRVRFRSDGVLYDYLSLESPHAVQLCACIKVLAHLDVAEKRRPQDGTFAFSSLPFGSDVRVATFPTHYGEKVVLRLLDTTAAGGKSLETLGLSCAEGEYLTQAVSYDSGCSILTGPTGSGKTTTAHALLSTLDATSKNIVSLEDPIEYILPGVTQSAIQPQLGITFEAGLRALLRQDPDVIFVGEIRDSATAHVAVQAALTGHQVITTLHTTDALSALIRLVHMGCERFLLASAVRVIVAQRLVRRNCNRCLELVPVTGEQAALLAHYGLTCSEIYEGKGCAQCRGTGSFGRIGIFEIVKITDMIKTLMNEQASYEVMYRAALQAGMRSLKHDAFEKLVRGDIPFHEWSRIALST